jgi:hypothetical protein
MSTLFNASLMPAYAKQVKNPLSKTQIALKKHGYIGAMLFFRIDARQISAKLKTCSYFFNLRIL